MRQSQSSSSVGRGCSVYQAAPWLWLEYSILHNYQYVHQVFYWGVSSRACKSTWIPQDLPVTEVQGKHMWCTGIRNHSLKSPFNLLHSISCSSRPLVSAVHTAASMYRVQSFLPTREVLLGQWQIFIKLSVKAWLEPLLYFSQLLPNLSSCSKGVPSVLRFKPRYC